MKRIIIGLIAAYSSIILIASEGNDAETRSTTVNIDINYSDLINIQAKYTELTIETWDKNEVEVQASIKYDGKMSDEIQEFLEQFENLVRKNIKYRDGELTIDSGVDFPSKGVKKSFFGLVVEINIGDYEQANLEYKIKAPASNRFIINTSYKDAQLIGDFAKMEITQYSGELTAEFIEKAKLNLKYGSATFKGIGNADIEMYEQEFESGEIQTLKLDAKYSDLEITEIGTLEAKSYETDYSIGIIGNLSGNFKYGEMEITQEIGTAKLTLYEQDIESEKIDKLILESSKYSKVQVARLDDAELIESYEDELTIGALGSLKSKNSKYGKYDIDQLQGIFILYGYEDKIQIDDVSSKAKEITIDGKYLDIYLGVKETSFQLNSKIKYGELNYNEETIDIRKYIKESDELEVELYSKKQNNSPLLIKIYGYEVDMILD
ncbi:MAG: hypothetical protein AB8B73_10185 [Ekhidna sp.]